MRDAGSCLCQILVWRQGCPVVSPMLAQTDATGDPAHRVVPDQSQVPSPAAEFSSAGPPLRVFHRPRAHLFLSCRQRQVLATTVNGPRVRTPKGGCAGWSASSPKVRTGADPTPLPNLAQWPCTKGPEKVRTARQYRLGVLDIRWRDKIGTDQAAPLREILRPPLQPVMASKRDSCSIQAPITLSPTITALRPSQVWRS